jgi:hypothetical protein
MKPNAKHLVLVRRMTKRPNTVRYDWINIAQAVSEIAKALNLPSEIAQVTLFGLIATGTIPASDVKGLIDIDQCTIADLEGRPAFVEAGRLRNWLRDYSKAPLPNRLDAVIAEKLQAGSVPGRNVDWKPFCDNVRDECNGWIVTGGKRKANKGFGDKTIQRRVKYLERL